MPIILREAHERDYPRIVDLVNSVFGLQRSIDWFEHFHLSNPAGRSILLVAEDQGQIVSYRSLVRFRAYMDGVPVSACQLSDASTRPAYRGNGLFGKLNAAAVERFFDEGGDFVFGFPGPMSYPIYTRRFGFREVKSYAQAIFPLKPMLGRFGGFFELHQSMFLRNRANPPLVRLKPEVEAVDFSLRGTGIEMERSREFLKWRTSIPDRKYGVLTENDGQFIVAGEERRRGLHVRTVMDARWRTNGRLKSLLSDLVWAAREENFDGVFMWLTRDNFLGALRAGFVPILGHRTRLVVLTRPDSPVERATQDPSSWSISMLDTDAY